MSNDGESLIVCGNSFHNLGAATEGLTNDQTSLETCARGWSSL
jgi:hypothetical protein